MNIPIENIYFLLCYAWDKLEEKDIVGVDVLESMTLADLFARVLINGTNHLIKCGFDRGYISHKEWTGRLRGKICFQEAVARNYVNSGKLPCEYDELSYNVLHNRILKATMKLLIRTRELEAKNAENLNQLCRLFGDIDDVQLNGRIFGRVQLHRNNRIYDFLLKICDLIYKNFLVSEKYGKGKFAEFIQDEKKMALLYEEFVRNFFKRNTPYKVKREEIYWNWTPVDEPAAAMLPKMVTDISLTSAIRKIIIDCKFTPKATQKNRDAEKLRSEHLYQIYAYMDNLKGPNADICEMMLLYPTVDIQHIYKYVHKGHKISMRTINLNQPWQGIHKDLMALVT